MKELIIREDIIYINFHQTILYSKIKENKKKKLEINFINIIIFFIEIFEKIYRLYFILK